ncbi:vancomycin high temperature exclusion protein [Gelidibacter japonicus]|uniref:SanA/YdcF family protein n=1 Tax=Gelidibacter japonicus TaxID=1962232 RepID=UPI0013D222D0|nr:ElyC/SanA/YdcF family protein [Gelidibacter japonicus]MCL8009169.1 YdcF family protein [Gelidibacter japonicus]
MVVLGVVALVSTNYWVIYKAKEDVYSKINDLPKNKVGLLLGTSKYMAKGGINLYYAYRIDAAVALFKAGKIDYILVSGDNGSEYYDEPTTFKDDLIKRGIPEDRIVLDFAGFRTLDSVVRAKEVFGQDAFTIISQKFHNERAIYLAKNFKIDAIAFNAKDVGNLYGLRTRGREYLARVKASIDVLFNVQPKFLGEKIQIE